MSEKITLTKAYAPEHDNAPCIANGLTESQLREIAALHLGVERTAAMSLQELIDWEQEQ